MVSMLLELSQEHGGSLDFDVIGKMRTLVSGAQLYAWRDKTEPFSEGRVHAKVAVADGRVCFITSANLTGYAMDRNMEAGVLITGGHIPRLLNDHLQALVRLWDGIPLGAWNPPASDRCHPGRSVWGSTLFPSRHRVAALFESLGLKALGLVEIAGHLPNASGCRSSRMCPRDEGGFEVY
jgi:hypothetical protein